MNPTFGWASVSAARCSPPPKPISSLTASSGRSKISVRCAGAGDEISSASRGSSVSIRSACEGRSLWPLRRPKNEPCPCECSRSGLDGRIIAASGTAGATAAPAARSRRCISARNGYGHLRRRRARRRRRRCPYPLRADIHLLDRAAGAAVAPAVPDAAMMRPSNPDREHSHGQGSFFGRRKGHRLRPSQADLIETLLPRLALDISSPAPAHLTEIFDRPLDAVRLEIGFGGGEHLAAETLAQPNVGFIGCEPYVNGMA